MFLVHKSWNLLSYNSSKGLNIFLLQTFLSTYFSQARQKIEDLDL